MTTTIDRRDFTRLLALTGSGLLLGGRAFADEAAGASRLTTRASRPDLWADVRARFLVPPELVPLNAANLCPSPAVVLERLHELTRSVDRDPSSHNRRALAEEREATRTALARHLRARPEELVLTRNTSEANNLVSNGLRLGAGDEVVIFGDNHPSNHLAWREKAARYGFTVRVVEPITPHPGPDAYLDAFARAMTQRTRLVAITHATNTVGDLLPAAAICRLGRERGALSLVDGAQTFGVLDVNLSEMQPDFFTGSGHKWPCGPRESGVLYVREEAQERLAPSLISLYPGRVGVARTHEGFGQRDDAAIAAFGSALEFQLDIGMAAIERRVRDLAQRLKRELAAIPGVRLWTAVEENRSAAVVAFRAGALDSRALVDALYERNGIIAASRGGEDRPGVRFSPHFYNLDEEIDRTVEAVATHLRRGL